jgi:peptidoglycan hydrolase CwlO-like protein
MDLKDKIGQIKTLTTSNKDLIEKNTKLENKCEELEKDQRELNKKRDEINKMVVESQANAEEIASLQESNVS